ncbi:hypothetical protein ACJZ2D_000256 [Fusarium nematophilum]
MGEFDCYCAICCAALHTRAEIGSSRPRALNRRRALVQRKRDGIDSDAEMDDDGMSEHESDDWYEDEEDHSYDPDLVSPESLEWLDEVSCIGFNPCATGDRRTFFADAAPYDDYGVLELIPGDDPNQPEETEVVCYDDRSAVFPFHRVCHRMLEKAFISTKTALTIDRDVLFEVMARLSEQYSTCLDINYGDISGRDQFWEPIPGEEFSVTSPIEAEDFYQHLMDKRAAGDFLLMPSIMSQSPAQPRNDPFSCLSNEVLCLIVDQLSGDELLSFPSASRSIHRVTSSNNFWKLRIISDMPWLWELRESLAEPVLQLDYKKLYGWLNAVTKPVFGVGLPFLAIANRRRIWQSCVELADHYLETAGKQPAVAPETEIVERVDCPLMLKAAPTDLPRNHQITPTLWLHSWQEMHDLPYVFETFWNDDGILIGIGVVFGNSRRILGSQTGEKLAKGFKAGNWISEMVLHIGVGNDSSSGTIVGIQGVTLNPRSRTSCDLGNPRSLGHRPLLVSEGVYPVGIQGQLGEDGIIARIGILECSKSEDLSHKPRPWTEKLVSVSLRSPLWQRPESSITMLFPEDLDATAPEDSLRCWETLVWARSEQERDKLYHVTARVPSNEDAPILAMRSEYVRRYWEPKRYIGDKYESDWPEDEMRHLTVDAAGGEAITEVGVTRTETLEGIMLRTNKGNYAIFGNGEEGEENWRMVKAPDGGYIVGIAASFDIDKDTVTKGRMASLVVLHEV